MTTDKENIKVLLEHLEWNMGPEVMEHKMLFANLKYPGSREREVGVDQINMKFRTLEKNLEKLADTFDDFKISSGKPQPTTSLPWVSRIMDMSQNISRFGQLVCVC